MAQLPRHLKDLRCYSYGCRLSAPTGRERLNPPRWHCTCQWPGGPARNKVKELSTRDVAIPCSTKFLWRPIVSFVADFFLGWLAYSLWGRLPESEFSCTVTTLPGSRWSGAWSICCIEPVRSQVGTAAGTIRAYSALFPTAISEG